MKTYIIKQSMKQEKKIKEEGVISIYSDLQREMSSLAKMASDEAQELQTALNTLKRI